MSLPRTRGDEPPPNGVDLSGEVVCPAHAGMSPDPLRTRTVNASLPRTRGDEPFRGIDGVMNAVVCPAHAGMSPRRGRVALALAPSAPHTRG